MAEKPSERVAIVGGGPAGLMAAERLAAAGLGVDLYDAMPSVGRKFLLAGKGGLNLTHSEEAAHFVQRYGARSAAVGRWLALLDAQGVRDWAQGLGIATFVGTSGRVFPAEMKAAPLLRAWLHRLRAAGVRLHMRHRWLGWADDGGLRLATPAGEVAVRPRATVLALGGASWPRLGSDGAWVPWLEQAGAEAAPLRPANCGFDIAGGWSAYFAERHAGQPFKSVALRFGAFARKGEFVATAAGIEGSLVYAASALLRDAIEGQGSATLLLDLLPDRTAEQVRAEVLRGRGARSLASHLKSRLGLSGIKTAVLHEVLGRAGMADAGRLADAIKALPLTLAAPRPVAEAISTAGGVRLESLDAGLMLRSRPGVFCAGEMLDWEAPTGGYLLTACLASGAAAAAGVCRWLDAVGGTASATPPAAADAGGGARAPRADAGLRAQYEAEVRALGAAASRMLASGDGEEQVAHWIVAQRNALKQRFRTLTPSDDRTRLEAWTLARYGNALGPSAAQLRDAGKSWRDIIDGAARPGVYRGKA